jgi:uncharacterized membrane protein YkoI
MIKKAIVAIVVIAAAAAIVFAATGNTNHINSTNSVSQANQQNLPTNNVSSDKSASDRQTKISSDEAKKIAQKYIEEPGATAGTPTLSKIDGKYVYTVPVIENGKNVGEIDIDATTGKNVGGAGGAP